MHHPISLHLRWLAAALALALECSGAIAREKIDVIVVGNGDRMTGEIVALSHGQLSLKTDYMGTVMIEWLDIVSIQSSQGFVVEDVHGDIYFGAMRSEAERGPLTIGSSEGNPQRIELANIARITPSEKTLWSRLQGSLSVGFDYAKASDITTLSGAFSTTYRGPEVIWSFDVDVNSTKDPAQGTLDRDKASFGYRWLRPEGKFWFGVSSLERNEETGVEARLLLGGGLGRYLVQTSRSEFSALLGAAATQEWATGEEGGQANLEGLVGADWRIFDFSTPKVSLSATGVYYPSMTESGRYRTTLNLSLRREIISDFYVDVSFYQSYDNQPPDVSAEKSDYGVTTSLGYSFY